jgi:hypothetical protein
VIHGTICILVKIKHVSMITNVPERTKEFKTSEKIRIRKKQQIAFRRWMTGKSGGAAISKYVGIDIGSLRQWINERMMEGMHWNNYGEVWVIDHIVPMRMFDIFNEDELKICWHYKNLMPLFKEDNLNKEGNVFYAFLLLDKIKGDDYFYNRLYERIVPEVDKMNKYILTYCNNEMQGNT